MQTFKHTNVLLIYCLMCLASARTIAEDQRHPLESVDTSSPRGTLESFLEEMHEAYVIAVKQQRTPTNAEKRARTDRILRCLDISEIPPTVRRSLSKEAAACLKEVLDRIELPPKSDWPGAEDVADQALTAWTIPHTEIIIQQVQEGPHKGEFRFSPDTVDRATEFYAIVKHKPYVDRITTTRGFYARFLSTPGWMIPSEWIPAWSKERWWGQAIWQWVGLSLTLLVAALAMGSIYLIGRWRAKTLQSALGRYLVTLLFPITAMLVPVVARYFIVQQLQIYGYLVITLTFALHVVFLLALMVVVVSVGNRIAELIVATPWVKPKGLDAQLIRLTCRMLSIIGASLVLLEGGQQLGIPLTTLLAGASVSGLALALAAQDSLKNVLGSMMIMLDKPFRVGERIVVKGYDGVVEDIGLRSTKIRLLTGHLVTIPNEELARAEIENIGRRPYLRQATTIELPSTTPPEKIKRALEILRTMLDNHEGMSEELPPRVFLRDVNEGSIGIFVSFWYHPPEYWDFLAFSEKVTLQMAEQFEAEGIAFASPRLTVQTSPPSDAATT